MEPKRQPAALPGSKLQQSGPCAGSGGLLTTWEPCLGPTLGPAHRSLLSGVPGVNRIPSRRAHGPSENSVWFCGYLQPPFPSPNFFSFHSFGLLRQSLMELSLALNF